MKTTCILMTAIVFLASCKEKSAPTTTAPVRESSAALAAVLAASLKGDPKAIATVRTSAKAGDEITLSGRIMGNAKPFVDGRAVFILGDPDVLTACNETPGDNCKTPWDACCDSPEDKQRGTATIQIVDADGRVLKESVEGVGGLANLASVTVTGTVADGSSPDLLIINAQAIQIGK